MLVDAALPVEPIGRLRHGVGFVRQRRVGRGLQGVDPLRALGEHVRGQLGKILAFVIGELVDPVFPGLQIVLKGLILLGPIPEPTALPGDDLLHGVHHQFGPILRVLGDVLNALLLVIGDKFGQVLDIARIVHLHFLGDLRFLINALGVLHLHGLLALQLEGLIVLGHRQTAPEGQSSGHPQKEGDAK